MGSILTDKAAVFIDNGYFSKVLIRDFNGPKIDYRKFSDALCERCERFRTYVYDCSPYQSPIPTESERRRKQDADRFHYSLNRLPRFEVRLGRLQRIPSPPYYEQKGVDVLLSIDLVRLSWANKIQKAIMVTADSDFDPAVRSAKEADVIVEVDFSQTQHMSDELYQICDERIPITKDMIGSSILSD